MNGIFHATHMEDGDVQLSTLAQRPDSDLSVFFPPRSGSQERDGEHQAPLSKQQRVHSDADEAYPSQNVSVSLLCAVVNALILCHLPLSNPQHHLQPLLPQVLLRLLQVWHRQDPAGFECTYSLDFKVEYEYYPHSLLAYDGLTVATVPQSSSVKRYSWKRDTA